MNEEQHTASDHDLLIELRTEMRGLKDAIEKMNDGTSTTIADHEARLRRLELWGGLAIGGVYVINVIIGYYLLIHH